MRKFHTSIWFRTAMLVFLISSILFTSVFGVTFAHTATQLKNQALENAGQSLDILTFYLSMILDNAIAAMYAYDAEDPALFGEREEALDYLRKNYAATNVAATPILIEDEEIIAIDGYNRWLYGIDVDVSVYRGMARKNRLVITSPYYSQLLAYRSVGIIRSVVDEKTGRERLIVSEINAQELFNTLKSKLDAYETLVVLAQDGQTIYFDSYCPFVDKTVGGNGLLEISDALRSTLIDLNDRTQEIEVAGRSYVVQKTVHERGWNLYMLIDTVQFNQRLHGMTKIYFFTATIAAIALMVTSILLSRWVLHPVRKLARQMDGMSASESAVLPEGKSQDEMEVLRRSFNRLMKRLHTANQVQTKMEKERYDLEYSVLQSQIQPHFLFNVHLCCQALIKDGQNDEALEMLNCLDELLRQSIQSSRIIPLRDEIQLCNSYIHMNKLRLGDRFDFSATGWERYGDVPVPKLLIQPILENALYHGLIGLDFRGEINLQVMEIEGFLHIVVQDNGRGIPQEKLDAIHQGSGESLTGRHGMVSIGLHNVRKRIVNYYGSDCGLYISSREGFGTQVEMVIRFQPTEMSKNQTDVKYGKKMD